MRRLLVLLLLLALPPLGAQVPAAVAVEAALRDGPHVLWKGREAQVLRVVEGRLETSARSGAFDLALPVPAPGPLRLDPGPPEPAPAEFPLPERVLAVSDPHGRLDRLSTLLQAHGVMDAGGRWTWGRGHLVLVGDIFDRGPQVTEILWLLRSLEAQAQKSGGRVHVLLGNHEAMVLQGDLRYLDPKYRRLQAGPLPQPLPLLFGPDSELGRWLRARPALVRLGPLLFVHGGLSPELVRRGYGLAEVNRRVRQGLDDRRGDPRTEFLMGGEGPLWYRGMIMAGLRAGVLDTGSVAAVLKDLGAASVVVGHTPGTRIRTYHGGLVQAIDAGILDGLPGEAWIHEGGRTWRGLADGRREPLDP